MEELKTAVIGILVQYLENAESTDMIDVLTDRAISAFREYRNYPSYWTEDEILADMTKHISCIGDLALYESIQRGAEFQSMHIESGLYRMWKNKGSVYTDHRVVPFVTL